MPPDRPEADALQIALAWRIRTDWGAGELLQRVARHAARAEGFERGSLSLAVVGERAMSRLHEQYTGIAGPTDVLTFDLDTDPAAGHLEGEVVVCSDVAKRRTARATAPQQAARRELALYVVHGILHLAGYDDHAQADFERMHAREDELLRQSGLGAVFATRPSE